MTFNDVFAQLTGAQRARVIRQFLAADQPRLVPPEVMRRPYRFTAPVHFRDLVRQPPASEAAPEDTTPVENQERALP